ncbi:hypothetical protein [Acidisoma sp. S159]|nr:hypothetical protein [Acidisoma sp. S159]
MALALQKARNVVVAGYAIETPTERRLGAKSFDGVDPSGKVTPLP